MTNEIKKRINALANEIQEAEDNDSFKGYLFHPHIKEMISLLDENQTEDLNDLEFSYRAYNFIGEIYLRMLRFSLAAENFEKALKVGVIYFSKSEGKALEGFNTTFSNVLRFRNFYVDDDCEDVIALVKDTGIMEEEVFEKTKNRIMSHRRTLKHDPVEMTKEYLDVIDEVEELIDKNETMNGFCLETWALKGEYLMERGIYWRSPALLNPKVRFD